MDAVFTHIVALLQACICIFEPLRLRFADAQFSMLQVL